MEYSFNKCRVFPQNYHLLRERIFRNDSESNRRNNDQSIDCENLNYEFSGFHDEHYSSRRFLTKIFFPKSLVHRKVGPIASAMIGISARIKWKNIHYNDDQSLIQWLIDNKWKSIIFFLTIFGSFYLYLKIKCRKCPFSGQNKLNLFAKEDFEILRTEYDRKYLKIKNKKVKNSGRVMKKLMRIFNRLFRSDKRFSMIGFKSNPILVIKSPVVDACALPNGVILIYSALLSEYHNENELSYIISHEFAHLALRHRVEKLSYRAVNNFVLMSVISLSFFGFPPIKAFLITVLSCYGFHFMSYMRFCRLKEIEADLFGLQIAIKAGFDVRRGLELWKRGSLQESPAHRLRKDWFSRHPSHVTRYEYMNNALKALGK